MHVCLFMCKTLASALVTFSMEKMLLAHGVLPVPGANWTSMCESESATLCIVARQTERNLHSKTEQLCQDSFKYSDQGF